MAGASGQKEGSRLQNRELAEVKPLDGGWGWMIVLGCALVNFTLGGLYKSCGVFFVEFMKTFEGSSSGTALISSLFSGVSYLVAPIACGLTQRYGCRLVVFIGALLGCLGLVLASLATRLEHLYFTYGIMSGIGAGFAYTPSTVIVGQYFEKRRAFANGICIAASSLGSMVYPPIFDYLVDEFLIHGACLLFSGVVLNGCIGALLFRPLEENYPKNNKQEILSIDQCADNSNFPKLTEKEMNKIKAESLHEKFYHSNNSLCNNGNDKFIDPESITNNVKQVHIITKKEEIPDIYSTSVIQSNESCVETKNGSIIISNESEKLSQQKYNSEKDNLELNELIIEKPLPKRLTTMKESKSEKCSDDPVSLVRFRNRTISVMSVMSNSSFHVMSDIFAAQNSFAHLKQKKLVDFSVLKMPIFIIFTFSLFIQSLGYLSYFLILPAYGESLGLAKIQRSWLLTIEAAAEFVSRLATGYIADFQIVNRKYIFITGLIVSGASIICIPYMTTLSQLIGVNIAMGLSIGCFVTITPTLWVDFVGLENLPSAWSLHMVFVGVGYAVGQPMAGYFKDATGNFVLPFAITGAEFILAGIIVYLERFVSKANVLSDKFINGIDNKGMA